MLSLRPCAASTDGAMSRGKKNRLLWLVVFIVAGSGFYYYRQHSRYKHVAIHDQGLVYRSAWVEADVYPELIERYQIRSVINLCDPGEMGEERWVEQRRAVERAGGQLINLPLPKTTDASDPVIAGHVAVLSNPNNYPILVHCQHGVTRTAMELAMYDILFRGMSADQSLAAMPLFGRTEHPTPIRAFARSFEALSRRNFPQTAGKLDVLRR